MEVKQAYDSHCNLVLGDVEESIYLVDEEDDASDEVRTLKKQSEMLFVRGMVYRRLARGRARGAGMSSGESIY